MNQIQRKRLQWLIGSLLLLAVVIALIAYALKQNISLYYTPTDLSKKTVEPTQLIRVGGMVVKGSVKRQNGLDVFFQLTDYEQQVMVHYQGILPDLFREGQGIVVKGRVSSNHIVDAIEVLAKHDENYMPPEVKQSLRKSNS